jgi:hypothetical protein
MVFNPCIQEHESKVMTNKITSKNVANIVIKKSNNYVQLQITH